MKECRIYKETTGTWTCIWYEKVGKKIAFRSEDGNTKEELISLASEKGFESYLDGEGTDAPSIKL